MGNVDLRLGIPLILFLFLSPWKPNLDVSSIFVQQFSIVELACLILALMFLLLFLFTSAELPINPGPISFRAGNFSIAVATSRLASLFFPPPLFWPFYFFIVVSSPCHGMIFNPLKQFFQWLSDKLRLLPTYSLTRSRPAAPLQEDVELGFTENLNEPPLLPSHPAKKGKRSSRRFLKSNGYLECRFPFFFKKSPSLLGRDKMRGKKDGSCSNAIGFTHDQYQRHQQNWEHDGSIGM